MSGREYFQDHMAGNVGEWVFDYYYRKGYESLELSNPVRSSPGDPRGFRVVRGGSWFQPRFYGRTYHRERELPNARVSWIGFRCARGLDD